MRGQSRVMNLTQNQMIFL